jgi:2-hydroxychromene-2-carboxylate isomerase
MTDLHFYYDVVCPYAYLASTRVVRFAESAGVNLIEHPILLGGLFSAAGAPQVPAAGAAPAKVRLGTLDLHRQAERAPAALDLNRAHPQRSVEAMRLVTAAPPAVRRPLRDAIFRAYHVNQGRIDREALAPLAAAHGVPLSAVDDPQIKDALRAETETAAALGVFGVPTFRLGDRLWWGNDRLDAVAHALRVPPLPETVILGPTPAPPVVEVFHDPSSPYSYLGVSRVEALAAEVGASVRWTPILLGALFSDIGTPLVPIATFSTPKQAWVMADLADAAARQGLPFRFPHAFPLRTVLALRVLQQAPAATHIVYRAAWAHNRDIGDPAVLQGVLDDEGFAGADLIANASSESSKQMLRDSTTRAAALGVCGAPSFRVEMRAYWNTPSMGNLTPNWICTPVGVGSCICPGTWYWGQI